MRFLLALTALLALALPAASAQAQSRPQVFVIVVDGLDGDRVDTGGAPFLSSLLAGREGAAATYWRESRSTMIAETNPNHTSMTTGAYGGTSGIPGNEFAVYGESNGSTCPARADESKPPATTDGQDPSCLQVETLFQSLDRQAGPGITTAAIFGKPKLGRMFAGKRPDGRYWADYLWAPCEGPSDDTPYCRQVPINPITQYAIDDATVMDEVVRVSREGVRADGANKQPDYTFVNLPQVDSAGHATGAGAAYDAAITLADQQIRRFVNAQRDLGRWGRNTVLILVSDHSMETTPEKTSLDMRFRAAGVPSDSYEIVQNGSASLVYLTNRRSPARFALLKQMREAALGVGNATAEITGNGPVSEALYREPNPQDGGAANTVDGKHPAWRLGGPRTGDLVVTHEAGGAFSDPINPLAGNHGGPQTRDNFMALIGPSRFVKQATPPGTARAGFDDTAQNPQQAENVDVAPTVARLLGHSAPLGAQGRVLTESVQLGALPAIKADPALGRLKVKVRPARVRARKRTRFTITVSAKGKRVRNARVSFAGSKRRTNRTGRVRITKRLWKVRTIRARAGKGGYKKGTARVKVLRRKR